MILYHVITTYQLLHCILHRSAYNRDKNCVLLLPDFIKDKFPHYKSLEGVFFDKVITFTNARMHKEMPKERFLENVEFVFDELFKSYDLQIGRCSEIIVSGAQGFFGMYLVSKNIRFVYVEEACGMISRPEVLESIASGISPSRHRIAKEFCLYDGDNPLVIRSICNIEAQAPNFRRDGLEHFDIMVELNKADKNLLDLIKNFFGAPDVFTVPENSILIFTQHFANLNVMTLADQKAIYRLLIDYFADNYNLVFKPHPDDLVSYETIFPGSSVIREKFPSELVPFIFSKKPESILTITSTAVNNLKGYFNDSIDFSSEYEHGFEMTHTYYCAMQLVKKLSMENVYSYNTDTKLLDNLLSHSDIGLFNKSINHITDLNEWKWENSVLLIDDIYISDEDNRSSIYRLLSELDDTSIVVFLNTRREYLFYDFNYKEIFEYCKPFEVNCLDLSEDEVTTHTIYTFTKRSDQYTMLDSPITEKELRYSNKRVTLMDLTKDQMKIKVLEGILEATEKRLNHYIKLEAELRSKLNESESSAR